MGLPSWSKWEMIEQFTAANIAKILLVGGAAIGTAMLSLNDKIEDVEDRGSINFAANEINSRVRQQEVFKVIIQGQLDTVKRVIEARPDGDLEPYRINRDTYQNQLDGIETEIANLKNTTGVQ